MRMLLLTLVRRLFLQILHVLVVIMHLLLIGRNVRLASRCQRLVPFALALPLLFELFLLLLLYLLRRAVGVFFESELWCDAEGPSSEWLSEGNERCGNAPRCEVEEVWHCGGPCGSSEGCEELAKVT